MIEEKDLPDYYTILSVPQGASDVEIKKSFRKRAREYHPDVAKDKKRAEETFKEINEAYETLGDPEKRRIYDKERKERSEQIIKREKYTRIQDLYSTGNLEGAVREAKSLFGTFPDDPDCRDNYAGLLYAWAVDLANKGRLPEAVTQFRLAADQTLDDKFKAKIRAELELLRTKAESAAASPPPRTPPKPPPKPAPAPSAAYVRPSSSPPHPPGVKFAGATWATRIFQAIRFAFIVAIALIIGFVIWFENRKDTHQKEDTSGVIISSQNPGTTRGTLQITSGTGAFNSVSSLNKTLAVAPGKKLNGAINLQAFNPGVSDAIAPLIWTPSWGKHSTSWRQINGWIPTGHSAQQAQVSFTAPTTPGIYYIIFAFAWEKRGDQVASGSSWPLGFDRWNDGNDIADFSNAQISEAQIKGFTEDNWLTVSGNRSPEYKPLSVPADALTIVVFRSWSGSATPHEFEFQRGDTLISIDGQPVNGLLRPQVDARLRGAATVTVLRQGRYIMLQR